MAAIRLDKAVQEIVQQRYGIFLPRSAINRILSARGVRYNGEVIKKKGFKFPDWQEAFKIELDEKVVKAVIEEYTTGRTSAEIAKLWDKSAPINQFEIRQEFIEKAPDVGEDVLFKDSNYVVLYKPPGVLSHPAQRDDADNMVYRFLKFVKHVDGFLPRGGLLHRLDKDTQGGMLFALNLRAFNYIKKQFNNQQVLKVYLVIFTPAAPTKMGKKLINMCKQGKREEFVRLLQKVRVLREDASEQGLRVYQQGSKEFLNYILGLSNIDLQGYIAMMRYENKAVFSVDPKQLKKKIYRKIKDAKSVIYPLYWNTQYNVGVAAVRLITGRTHQIRAQFRFMGLPILGDSLYTPPRIYKEQSSAFSQTFYLHLVAMGLGFENLNGAKESVVVPLEKLRLNVTP